MREEINWKIGDFQLELLESQVKMAVSKETAGFGVERCDQHATIKPLV
jgi:hypothetical protein